MAQRLNLQVSESEPLVNILASPLVTLSVSCV